MAGRTRKNLSFDEQLQQLDIKIADLQKKRDVLLSKKKHDALEKLSNFMRENNLTPEDIRAYLPDDAVAASAGSEDTELV